MNEFLYTDKWVYLLVVLLIKAEASTRICLCIARISSYKIEK